MVLPSLMSTMPFLISKITVGIGRIDEAVSEFCWLILYGGCKLIIVKVAVFHMKVYIVFFVLFLTHLWNGFLISNEGLVSLGGFRFGVEIQTRFGLLVTHSIIQIEFITVWMNVITIKDQSHY